MHELSITAEMIDVISKRLEGEQGRRITRVVLEVGVMTAVFPDAIRFCFEICARDTPVEGADLEIIEVPATGTCRSCGGRVEAEGAYALCPCGSAEVRWKSGQELKIREVEIE